MAKKNKRAKRKRAKSKTAMDEPKEQAIDSELQRPSMAMNTQSSSVFFHRLPQEIRDSIYAHLFSSTKFTFGYRANGHSELPDGTGLVHYATVKPEPNGLALLRACRRAKLEIGDSWLTRVQFWFTDAKAMLDRLSVPGPDTVSKIRSLTVYGKPFILTSEHHTASYTIESAFRLLPGLRLDQLTVLSSGRQCIDSATLSAFIKKGSGWKTLRYVTYDKPTFAALHELHHGAPIGESLPPMGWQSNLEARDGKVSRPSVTVYHAKTTPQDPIEAAEALWHAKKTMIVAKRGSGVDYQENTIPPHIYLEERQNSGEVTREEICATAMGDHVRWDFPGMTWAQIRAAYEQNRAHEGDHVEQEDPGAWVRFDGDTDGDVDEVDWVLHPCHLQE